MRSITKFLIGLAVAAGILSPVSAQDTEVPAISFKTNIYNEYGAENKFHFIIGSTNGSEYYDVDMGFGNNEVEVGYATVVDGAWEGTTVKCRVSADGVVNIYGDPTKIDVFIAEGCYITEIDLSRCVNLDVVNLEHNELKSLDLSANTNLRAIYISDNPGTEASPLKIGTPKPNLQIIEADIIDHFDPQFKPEYPNLVSLDLYHNMSVKSLDLSGCPKLVNLVVEFTGVEKLDLTPVPNLWHLNIAESRITDIDLSKTPDLMEFLCSHTSGSINTDCKLTKLDVSKNPKLTYLAASDNLLEKIDVSANPKIKNLYLRNNCLGDIDVSALPDLYSLDLTGNRFGFSTLPAERETFGEYFYSQKPKTMNKAIAKGTTLKFPEMLRTDGATYARVMIAPEGKDAEEMAEANYTWNGTTGDLVINDTPSDSVYVEFANAALPSYTLTTSRFMVKSADDLGKPSKMVTLGTLRGHDVSLKVGIDGATAASPRKILVDFGNGELKEFNVTSTDAASTIAGTVNSADMLGQVNMYLPEGETLTALDIDNLQLVSIDLTAARELRSLSITRCNLAKIDLSYNRCLTSLNLADNRLSSLDLAGIEGGGYEKNVLTRIEAPRNRLTSVHIVNTGGLLWLDLADNRLTEFNLKDYDLMEHLDLSGNRLSTVNLAYMGNADYISLADNNITLLENITEMPRLNDFIVTGNRLTIPTLPLLSCSNYAYAPQQPVTIAKKAPTVSLADQIVDIKGATTSLHWVFADGTPMIAGTDYTIADGKTRFITIDKGPAICHISHPAFPAFSGDNILATTQVQPMGAPTTVVATFKVSGLDEAGSSVGFTTRDVTNLYIDWTGDRIDYCDYPASAEFSSSDNVPAEAVGHTATIYTYDSPEDLGVVSISGIGMSEFNGAPLTGCYAFMLYGSDIDVANIAFPNAANLRELSLSRAKATALDLSKFPSLTNLALLHTDLTSIDLSKCPALLTAALGSNALESVKFNNPKMWGLDLSSNNLSSIDLNGLPALSQLQIANNALKEIDLSPVASTLQAVMLSQNSFRFSTLPDPASLPALGSVFFYSNQAKVPVELVDSKIDLSAEAKVGETATVYKWYYGDITVDLTEMTVTGEELQSDGDDPEVTVENGISTFHVSYDEPVTCVMTNAQYPSLMLITEPVRLSGIADTFADSAATLCDVYTVSGVVIRSGVEASAAIEGLDPGLYIVAPRNGGKATKVAVR